MKSIIRKLPLLLLATSGAIFVGQAGAQTWNFGSGSGSPNPVSCAQTTAGCTSSTGNLNVKVSAWATSSDLSTSRLQSATITDQNGSGIGVTSASESTGSPDHAIDSGGKDELILLNFGTNLVKLSQFSTGWSQQDTDISILRWDGGSNGPDLTTMSITGTTDGLLAKGWTLVSAQDIDKQTTDLTQAPASGSTNKFEFGTLNSDTFSSNANASNSTGASSWWIVSAYFGSSSGNLTANNDYFKLLSVTGTCVSNTTGGACNDVPRGVPEPGSLAMAGLALMGLAAMRRRQRNR